MFSKIFNEYFDKQHYYYDIHIHFTELSTAPVPHHKGAMYIIKILPFFFAISKSNPFYNGQKTFNEYLIQLSNIIIQSRQFHEANDFRIKYLS